MQTTYFNVTGDRKISAAFFNYFPRRIKHPNRVMSQHDFLYMIEGEWDIFQNEETFSVRKNDLIILTANAHHGSKTRCSEGAKILFMHVNAMPGECVRDETDFIDSKGMPLHTLIHCDNHPGVQKNFEKIIDTFSLDEPYRKQRLNTLFSDLLIRLYDADNVSITQSDDEFIQQLRSCFLNNPKIYSNKELAAMFFVCEETFVKRFKKLTGTTPHHYQLNYKLQNIKSMLVAYPDMTLRELALRFGFCDEFHMSKAFKAAFGTSPSEFKKSSRYERNQWL